MKRTWSLAALAVVAAALAAGFGARIVQSTHAPRALDHFDSVGGWSADASDDVQASLQSVPGKQGQAVQLDFDFNGRSGHAGLRRKLAVDWPEDFELSLSGQNLQGGRHPEFFATGPFTRTTIGRSVMLALTWGL